MMLSYSKTNDFSGGSFKSFLRKFLLRALSKGAIRKGETQIVIDYVAKTGIVMAIGIWSVTTFITYE